jgi:geranylgeranyl pyrophosphate synthase
MKMERKKSRKLMEQAQMLLKERGQKAFEIAKSTILQEDSISGQVYEALRYFMEESWYDVQHPALLSLACEAVGGNPEITVNIGAAIVLLAGAADIHDDIVDRSKTKNSKLTVLGKFGKDIALLAGDALLFRGIILLYEACEELPKKQGHVILNSIKQAFFTIGNAEAKEISLKGKYNLAPREYRNIIEAKAAVADASMRIGAILGGGKSKEIAALGHYGRTLGVLMTIRDDFIDMFEPDELKNRAKNECLPLPILYAFQNVEKKNEIAQLLEKNRVTKQETQTVIDVVMSMKEAQSLKEEMRLLINREVNQLNIFKGNKTHIILLLKSTLEDL